MATAAAVRIDDEPRDTGQGGPPGDGHPAEPEEPIEAPSEPAAETGPSGQLSGESLRTLAIVLLVGLLVLIVMQPGLAFDARIASLELYGELTGGTVATTSEEPLTIEPDDVAYLNRIFTEQDQEVGYCGLIGGDRRMRPWLAQLGAATDTSVLLSVRNCPTGAYPGLALIHTHPNGDARPTTADRESLRLDGVDVLCIQHGQIQAGVGERTGRLRCYVATSGPAGAPSIGRVPVVVSD